MGVICDFHSTTKWLNTRFSLFASTPDTRKTTARRQGGVTSQYMPWLRMFWARVTIYWGQSRIQFVTAGRLFVFFYNHYHLGFYLLWWYIWIYWWIFQYFYHYHNFYYLVLPCQTIYFVICYRRLFILIYYKYYSIFTIIDIFMWFSFTWLLILYIFLCIRLLHHLIIAM